MPITIGSNILALAAQRRLNEADSAASRSLERLSSGLRINRASDDAAGLAIAATLQADSRVFSQGIKNVNDGISMLSIAEGALRELSNVVIRQQELAEQAANGILSPKQRMALHSEATALTSEYNRIIASTSFNGIKMLDGSGISLTVQAGYGTSGAITFSLGADAARAAGDGTFAAAINKADGNGTVYDIVSADFNNDGNLDYSIGYSGSVQTFLGNGDSTFNAAIVSTIPAGSKYSIGHGDTNNDGFEDIVVANSTGSTFTTVLGNGNGTFKVSNSYSSGMTGGLFRSYVGDVNNDGRADVVSIAINGTVQIGVALANANGTFGATTSFVPTGITSTDALNLGDFNNDGNLDLAMGDFSSGNMVTYLGTGTGSFKSPTITATGGSNGGRPFIADLNNDGFDDIVGANSITSQANVLLSNGDGTFRTAIYSGGGTVTLGALDDYNGDGIADIAMSDNGGARIQVLLNNGDGTFRAPNSYATAAGITNGIASGDFNNDGVNDLVMPNFGSAQVSLLLGRTRQTTTIAYLDLTSQESALEALDITQDSLTRINNELGRIGAFQSRLESTVAVLEASRENYLTAAARITDVDIAMEASQLVTAMIRRQAAAAIAGQANIAPRIALTLLESVSKP